MNKNAKWVFQFEWAEKIHSRLFSDITCTKLLVAKIEAFVKEISGKHAAFFKSGIPKDDEIVLQFSQPECPNCFIFGKLTLLAIIAPADNRNIMPQARAKGVMAPATSSSLCFSKNFGPGRSPKQQ